jgi:hypothetical protein
MAQRGTTGRDVSHPAGLHMPIDRGLSSLGLIMQLGGSVFFAVMVMELAVQLLRLAPHLSWSMRLGDELLILLAVCAAAAVRSGFHRAAGRALVFGSSHGRFFAAYVYIGVALAQSALTLWLINQRAPLAVIHNLVAALILLGWPIVLLVVLTRPAMRSRAIRGEVFVSEDMGFEGASAIMTLLGMVGALAALFMVHAAFQTEGSAWTLALVGVCALLVVRSIVHAMTGMRGLRGVKAAGAIEAAGRYVDFGVLSSMLGGGAILLVLAIEGPSEYHFPLAGTAALVYLLFSWPLILRRFHRRRCFRALRDGTQGMGSRRAPDAGMTAIGWLLLATGIVQVGVMLASVVPLPRFDAYTFVHGWIHGLDGRSLAVPDWPARSPGWTLVTCALQLWAAVELIRMTARHRLAVTTYAGVSLAITIFTVGPQADALMRVISSGLSRPSVAGGLIQIAFWLIVPVAAMVLVLGAGTRTTPAPPARPSTSA